MRMSPEYTDCAVSSTAPLNSRSLRVSRRVVVLQRAEVEHLVAVAEVDRGEVALARPSPIEQRLAAQPRVVAAQRDRRRPQRRVAAEVRALQRDLPRARPVLLHRDVAHVGVVADDQLDDRVDEVAGASPDRCRWSRSGRTP